jgi:hypothetical protein
MTGRFIPVEEAARKWLQDPEFQAAYDALEHVPKKWKPLFR